MSEVAKKLNLKEHTVGKGSHVIKISTAADLEVHLGFDSRFYCLDLSR